MKKLLFAIVLSVVAFLTTNVFYGLPDKIFPYTPPGYHEVYEQEWDGRSNPIVPTGEMDFYPGGHNAIIFRGLLVPFLLIYIAYTTGKLIYYSEHTFFYVFFYTALLSLILHNVAWLFKSTAWSWSGFLQYSCFVLGAISLVISFVARGIIKDDIKKMAEAKLRAFFSGD